MSLTRAANSYRQVRGHKDHQDYRTLGMFAATSCVYPEEQRGRQMLIVLQLTKLSEEGSSGRGGRHDQRVYE